MNIIVIGLGSMGKRRIRILKSMLRNGNIIGVDPDKERCNKVGKELEILVNQDINMALDEYSPDCVFVSSPPLSHAEIIHKCLEYNCHVFSEINLVSDGYKENILLATSKNRVLFLSSTLLYRKEIQHIKKRVENTDNTVNYIYHVGQYLPDWHPWEKYQEFFVSDKRTNGCRELLAIELPWIIEVFGDVKSVDVHKRKLSSLDVSYYDSYQMILEHDNGNKGFFTVDVVTRKATRRLEIYNENIYITWDGTPSSLFEYDYTKKEVVTYSFYDKINNNKDYAPYIVENAYESEMISFFEEIEGEYSAKYSFEKDLDTINLIEKIEG